MAGVALATYGTGLILVSRLSTLGRAWARLVAGDAAVLCVAGRMALGDIHLRFAWQAFHLRFAWQAWHLPRYGTGLALVARLGAFGRAWSPVTPRYFYVAGVALGDIHLRFAWQVCHLVTSTFVLRGRRGTYGTGLALVSRLSTAVLCVAGRMLLGDIHLRFAWQVCHLVTSTFVLRGRRGTYGTGLALVARLGALGHAWARLVAGDAAVLCVAGVAHPPSLRVTGVPLMALGWLWWRAWAR